MLATVATVAYQLNFAHIFRIIYFGHITLSLLPKAIYSILLLGKYGREIKTMSEKKSSSNSNSGYVVVQVPSDLYKAIEQHASQRGQTVDQWVEEAVRHEMETLKRETGS